MRDDIDSNGFKLSDSNTDSQIFRINGGFGLGCNFSSLTSVEVKVLLGPHPDLMTIDPDMTKTLTTSDNEAWDIETNMKYAQVKTVSANPYEGTFYISR